MLLTLANHNSAITKHLVIVNIPFGTIYILFTSRSTPYRICSVTLTDLNRQILVHVNL